jgi:hypothetical protein
VPFVPAQEVILETHKPTADVENALLTRNVHLSKCARITIVSILAQRLAEQMLNAMFETTSRHVRALLDGPENHQLTAEDTIQMNYANPAPADGTQIVESRTNGLFAAVNQHSLVIQFLDVDMNVTAILIAPVVKLARTLNAKTLATTLVELMLHVKLSITAQSVPALKIILEIRTRDVSQNVLLMLIVLLTERVLG